MNDTKHFDAWYYGKAVNEELDKVSRVMDMLGLLGIDSAYRFWFDYITWKFGSISGREILLLKDRSKR